MKRSRSSALWWVLNGRAAAPPRIECIIGVSTSRKPRASRKRRMPRTIARALAEDLAHLRVDDEVDVALAVADLDVRQAVPLLGQRARRLGEHHRVSARIVSSPVLVNIAPPTAPMKSPRSTFFQTSKAASPTRSFLTQTWISPVRSRIFTNVALPKPAVGDDAPGDGEALLRQQRGRRPLLALRRRGGGAARELRAAPRRRCGSPRSRWRRDSPPARGAPRPFLALGDQLAFVSHVSPRVTNRFHTLTLFLLVRISPQMK